jgi:hypothetical protein
MLRSSHYCLLQLPLQFILLSDLPIRRFAAPSSARATRLYVGKHYRDFIFTDLLLLTLSTLRHLYIIRFSILDPDIHLYLVVLWNPKENLFTFPTKVASNLHQFHCNQRIRYSVATPTFLIAQGNSKGTQHFQKF